MLTTHSLILFLAAMAAGAVNSVAGGGTLLTFPALMATGQVALLANATSTVALWPGTVTSCWGYRDELRGHGRVLSVLVVLGVLGGAFGSWLLLVTPSEMFDRIVPFLVLGATLLLLAQEPISRWVRKRAGGEGNAPRPVERIQLHVSPALVLAMFGTAVYGGYFGAGIGIITLAVMSFLGLRDIHQMNALKNVFAMAANGVAAGIFIMKELVDWRLALLMAVGSMFGGYAGAGIARRIGQKNVRRVVIAIGLGLTVRLFLR